MPDRIYIAGSASEGSNPKVAWIDTITQVVTELPYIGTTYGNLESIAVIAENDIWVGWNYTNSNSSYPKLAHWDGVSWDIHELTFISPSFENYGVFHIYAVSSTEVYAIVHNAFRVVKWNGSFWSSFIYTLPSATINSDATIMPGSTATDMWIANYYIGGFEGRVAHWNGASFTEWGEVNPAFATVDGVVYYKGDIIAASGGKAYKRTGFETWVEIFSAPVGFSPSHKSLWVDTAENILWAGTYYNPGVNTYGVGKWDGSTFTFHEDTSASGTSVPSGITGLSTGGGSDADIWRALLDGSSVSVRNSDGSWEVIATGGKYSAIDALSDSLLPPVIQNQDPSPNEINVPINRSLIEFDIVSPSTTINASSIDAYVDGYLALSNETFNSPFNGPDAYFDSIISAEGYDGYKVVLDYTNTPWEISQTIIIDAYGQDINGLEVSDTWSFTTETDPYPPFLDGYDPDAYEKFVPIYSTVSFNILDTNGVTLNTIDAYVDGYLAINNGIIQSLFDGADAYFSAVNIDGYDGYSYVLDYEYLWGADKQIDVRVIAEDTIGNLMDITYPFYTPENIPPIFINKDPYSGETKVLLTNNLIEFDIVSTRTEVFPETIDAYVNGQLVFYDETFVSPFDGLDAYFGKTNVDGYDGYKIKLDYTDVPWDDFQTIVINAYAEDAYGFSANDTWNFRTQDITAPTYKIGTIHPKNTENIEKDVSIFIEIYDTQSGVDSSTIDAYVNGVQIYDGYTGFVSGFNGSIVFAEIDGYDGYRITINKNGYYKSGERVKARIYAKDNEGN